MEHVGKTAEWYPAQGFVMVEAGAEAWGAEDDSGGKARNPRDRRPIEPWPYPLAGVLVEIVVEQPGQPSAESAREFFFGLNVGGERLFVCRDNDHVRRLGGG